MSVGTDCVTLRASLLLLARCLLLVFESSVTLRWCMRKGDAEEEKEEGEGVPATDSSLEFGSLMAEAEAAGRLDELVVGPSEEKAVAVVADDDDVVVVVEVVGAAVAFFSCPSPTCSLSLSFSPLPAGVEVARGGGLAGITTAEPSVLLALPLPAEETAEIDFTALFFLSSVLA